MRKAAAVVLSASLALAPLAAHAQTATPTAPTTPQVAEEAAVPAKSSGVDPRLLVAGAGAVMGILAFNILSAPLGTVPLAGAALAPVPVDIALGSRLIAAMSGAAGAAAAAVAWDQATGEQHDYGRILALSAGALGGVAIGNMLYGPLGTLPYYAGSGVAAGEGAGLASSAAQAASRVYVIASGVLGAWVADYLYGVN
ncbi:hypothetical protein HL658_32375 [Azospirillum sp. RWY-5-1]|uniref:Uncharacterized protein n=1 Tax=Azospirillum oleiclasticum TaxID=2735135 RepID=A0ABX2TLD8_9PROT|nr:hypothetical protein [Azospirillum oleiclasticum]NYZ17266.1 hypothetical protein [Azospirillum oleiclasticum]NYZ23450.1 hypothetical protein [Azospirillum oleiclasticum]